ncbi:sulfonate ABC transporter substrate-binding protein [Lonepinella koalarum]|uniref:Putative aliphatic sulfonates-binding protein n=1 Tax=Lonepinella koalarum TaxID=53417 RepID=A0A4R1KWJ4_9PAST|nr:sulfonate ABC transporter substrate-binding protein [Lonepinella koalarum]MDH2926455.1 ABC transporter substrate-binding protein [Lonepinella koalarum]TCK69608.1 sulfonate transport system substrate-binding protein [Lonepinella koalarum]TFJ89850.1 sulfonate ABC transporter substrate-binding protein [Lonepinella koalarum]
MQKLKQFFHRSLAVLVGASFSFGTISHALAADFRIGYQKSNVALIKAKENIEKRLGEQGVEVKWTEFPGGPQLLEGLNVGSVDFGVTGETPPVFAQAAKADLLYVANDLTAPTSEAIIIPKDSPIQSVAELKGKKVAYNKGSNVHYLLVRALEEAGLKYDDIESVYLPPADARAAFERGSVDAWVIWDPYFAAAEQQLGARILRDGTNLVDNHRFYLSTRDYANKNPQVIGIVVEEIRNAGEWTKQHLNEVAAEFAPVLGLPKEIVYTTTARHTYGTNFISPEVVEKQQKIADTFTELKLIPEQLNIKNTVWTPSNP